MAQFPILHGEPVDDMSRSKMMGLLHHLNKKAGPKMKKPRFPNRF